MNAPDSHSAIEPLVQSSASAGIARLTLNRPEQLNALSEQMLAALDTELGRIAADGSVRAVVIGGAGKAFCA